MHKCVHTDTYCNTQCTLLMVKTSSVKSWWLLTINGCHLGCIAQGQGAWGGQNVNQRVLVGNNRESHIVIAISGKCPAAVFDVGQRFRVKTYYTTPVCILYSWSTTWKCTKWNIQFWKAFQKKITITRAQLNLKHTIKEKVVFHICLYHAIPRQSLCVLDPCRKCF